VDPAGLPQGRSVAISGGKAVYVFTRSTATWTQQQKLQAGTSPSADSFGYSVSLKGDDLIAGATGEDNDTGAAYVFTRSGTTWTMQQRLTPSNGDDGLTYIPDVFGYDVTIDGDTAVVSASWEGSCSAGIDGSQTQNAPPGECDYSGAAYVFTRSTGSWSQAHYLKASNSGAIPESSNYHTPGFGESLALAGSTLVVGAVFDKSCAKSSDDPVDQWALTCGSAGAAHVFDTGVVSADPEVTVTNTTEPLWKASFKTAEVTLSATVVPSTVTPCEVEWTLDPDPGTGPYTAEVTGEEVSTTVDLPPGFYTVTVSVSGTCEASAESVLTGNIAVIGSRDGTSDYPHVDGSGKYTDPDTGKRATYYFHWEYDRYNNFKGRVNWTLFPDDKTCGVAAPATKSHSSSYLCKYPEWRVYQAIDDEVTYGEGDDAITASSWGLIDCPTNVELSLPPAATPICSQISVKVRLQQRIGGVWTDSGEDYYIFLTLIEGRTILVPYRYSFKAQNLPDFIAVKFQRLDGTLPDGIPDVADVLSQVGTSGIKHMKR